MLSECTPIALSADKPKPRSISASKSRWNEETITQGVTRYSNTSAMQRTPLSVSICFLVQINPIPINTNKISTCFATTQKLVSIWIVYSLSAYLRYEIGQSSFLLPVFRYTADKCDRGISSPQCAQFPDARADKCCRALK